MDIKMTPKRIVKTAIIYFLAIIGIAGLYAEDITGRIVNISGSATVDFFNSPVNLVDNDPSTSCLFGNGASDGWIEISLDQEYEIHGLEIDGYSSADSLETRVEYFSTSGWIPFSLSYRKNDDAFERLDLSFDRKVSDRIRISLASNDLSAVELSSLVLYGTNPEITFSKVEVSDVESSFNTSHFYSADYLTDGNVRTLWAAYPYLFKKFPGQFSNNEIHRLDDVSAELDFLEGLSSFFKSFYTFFSEMDAELVLSTPSEIEFINLYFTDKGEGDFSLSVLSGGVWSEIFSQSDTDELDRGWIRVPVDTSIGMVEKVSVHFEGDAMRLGGLSEVEIWGRGDYNGKTVINIPIAREADLSRPLVIQTMQEKKRGCFIDFELSGLDKPNLVFDYNGREYSADRIMEKSGSALYSAEINIDHIWEDGNYITLPALGEQIGILSLKIVDRENDLSLLFDNYLSDGFLYNEDQTSSAVQFDFDNSYYFNKLNLHSLDQSLAQIFLNNGSDWEAQLDYKTDNEITTYEINKTGDKIIVDTGYFSSVSEVEFLASPLESQEPDIRILWPSDGEILSKGFTSFTHMVGFIDNPEATITVNNQSVKQKGHTFWLPLKDFDVDENGALFLDARAETLEGDSAVHSIMIFEDGYMMMSVEPEEDTIFTNDENIVFTVRAPASMAIVAEVGEQVYQVEARPGGVSLNIPLDEGFSFISLKGINKRNGKFYRIFHKKVIRNTSGATVDVITPSEGTWTNSSSTMIEGVVIGSGEFTVTVNNIVAVMNGNYFKAEGVTLEEGENSISIVGEESEGNVFGKNIVLYNDITAPELTVTKPLNGDVYGAGYIPVTGTVDELNASYVLVNGKRTSLVNGAFSAEVLLYGEGEKTVEILAVDIAGNKSELVTRTVSIDTVPPLPFQIHSDREGWTNVQPTLTFSTTDETSGISHYEISVNGEPFQRVSSPYTVPYTNDGALKVYIKAFDTVGNYRTEETFIYIDTTAPLPPANFRGVPGNGVAEARWEAVGEDAIEYRVFREDTSGNTITFTTTDLFIEETGLTNGDIIVYSIVSVDRAGNLSDRISSKAIEVGRAVEDVKTGLDETTVVEFVNTRIDFESGSIPADITKIVVRENHDPELKGLADFDVIGPMYDFSVVQSVNGTEVEREHIQFDKPYLAEIKYDSTLISNDFPLEKLNVYFFNDFWRKWEKVQDCEVDSQANIIRFSVDHFSTFAVQPTVYEAYTPEDLIESGISPFDSATTYGRVNVSPQGGSASVSVTEVVLPGAGDFQFELKRTYDTGTARSNAYGSSIAEAVSKRLNRLKVHNIDYVLGDYSLEKIEKVYNKVHEALEKGDTAYSIGIGWKFELPAVFWSGSGYSVRLPDGSVHSTDSMIFKGEYENIPYQNHFEMHEGADFSIVIKRYDVSKFENLAKLMLADGSIWEFDNRGLAKSYTDPTGLNVVKFQYTSSIDAYFKPIYDLDSRSGSHNGDLKVLSKIYLDIQQDGMESKEWEINFKHDKKSFFFPVITGMTISETPETPVTPQDPEIDEANIRSVEYVVESDTNSYWTGQFLPLLKSATDIGGRKSNYTYHQIEKEKFESETIHLLRSISSPGQGYQQIEYSLPYMESDHAIFKKRDVKIVVDNLLTSNVENPMAAKSEAFSYDFQYAENKQFLNMKTSVSDGMINKLYYYDFIERTRTKWGEYSDGEYEARSWHKKDVSIPFNTRIETYDINGQFIEKQEFNYDTGNTMRLLYEKRIRSATNFSYSNFAYDTWGNRTFVKQYSRTGDRINDVETRTHYHNSGSLRSPNAPWKPYPYGIPALTNNNIRNLPLERIVKNTIPASVNGSEEHQIINTAWGYNSLGQKVGEAIWSGNQYAKTQYSYDTYGNIVSVKDPNNHVTSFTYDYAPTPIEKYPNQYIVTKTENGVVDANGTPSNIVSRWGVEYITGVTLWDENPRHFLTEYKYDKLGRKTETRLLGENVESALDDVVTAIDYDDVNMITTVTDPLGAIVKYQYDTLGRLVEVNKALREESGSIRNSVYNLGYDVWDNVISLKDPNSNITRYEYDAMNRMKKISHPEENDNHYSKTMSFNYENNIQTVTDEEGNSSYETYDLSGRLIHLMQRNGVEEINSYSWFDGLGNEVKRTDGNGNSTTVEFNERQQPLKTTMPVEEFFENGAFTTTSAVNRSEYDLAGRKVKDIIVTANGELEVCYAYDGLGRLIETSKSVDGVDLVEKSFYDDNGNLVESIDANGKSTTYKYSYRDQVIEEINPANGLTTYDYDAKNRKISMTDPRGNSGKYIGQDFTIDYFYDDLDRIIRARLPETSSFTGKPVIEFEYDLRGNVLKQINPDGGITSFTYTGRNNKETETIRGTSSSGTGLSYTTRYTYNGLGNVSTVESPSGEITTHLYDDLGRVSMIKKPENNNSYFEYDNVGNQTIVKDGKGNITETVYDAYNRVDYIKDALEGVTDYSYDRMGNQTRYEDSNHNVTVYNYDILSRLIEEKNALDEINSYTYDAVGNVQSHIDPTGTIATYKYNDLYLQIELLLENEAKGLRKVITNGWDEAGDLMWSEDDGVRTEYNTYADVYSPDPYSRVWDITRFIDDQEIHTGYRYDVMNRISEMVYPSGEKVEYVYNNVSQLEKVPGYIDHKINYNLNGYLESFINTAGLEARFGYDNSSRQTEIRYFRTEDILKEFEFDYDKADNIIRKNNSSYVYDHLNRLKTSNEIGKYSIDVDEKKADNPDYSQRIGTARFDVAAQKKLDFNSENVELKFDYASTSIGVDLGYDTYVTHLILRTDSISHRIDETNTEILISTSNFKNGYEKITEWIWEEKNNEITIIFREPVYCNYLKVHSKFDERDENNLAIDEATFRNNNRDLLTVFYTANMRDEVFEYDSKGNRLTSNSITSLYTTVEKEEGNTYTYYLNSDRLKTVVTENGEKNGFAWDSNGNMIARGSEYTDNEDSLIFEKSAEGYTEYHYDLLNRLECVWKTDELGHFAEVVSYTYDTKGYRIKKRSEKGDEYYAFSLDGLLLKEENDDESVEYIYAFKKVIAERRDGEKYFYLTDHLGSTVLMTDDQGNILWQNDFTPFGEETGESGFVERDGFYTGKKIDRDTGLYYFNARWYDPELGRFITEDPVKDGLNWYSYVGSNPLRYVDPTGLYLYDIINGQKQSDTINRGASMGSNPDKAYSQTRGFRDQTIERFGCLFTAGVNIGNTLNAMNSRGNHVGPSEPIQFNASDLSSNDRYFRNVPNKIQLAVEGMMDTMYQYDSKEMGASELENLIEDISGIDVTVRRIGDDEDAAALLKKMNEDPEYGYFVIGNFKNGNDSHFPNVEDDVDRKGKYDVYDTNDFPGGKEPEYDKDNLRGGYIVEVTEDKERREAQKAAEERNNNDTRRYY